MNGQDKRRVVITGIGIVAPCGLGKRKFWDLLKKGKSAIKPITGFDTKGLRCKVAGEVKNFDIKRLLDVKGLRALTRSTEFALVASKLALDDAKLSYPVKGSAADSCGVSLGTSTGSTHSVMEFHKEVLTEGPRFVDPLFFSNATPNAIASQISIKFNIKGFNTTISSSCSTGLNAIYYASSMIKDYGYKVGLAGSVEELSWEEFVGLIKVKCLTSSKSVKNQISRPYDKTRDGIVPSEGACIFILEDLEHAKKRKAKIYAELKGYGFSFDPKTKRGFSPNTEGAQETMRQALAEFNYPRRKIDYIASSANSTPGCDSTEAGAVRSVFKYKINETPVTSVKSMIGESFAAGGSFNVAAAIGSLEEDFIPPTINYRFPDKRCNLNLVANKTVKKRINNILVNAFSYNGLNASVVIGKPDS